MSLRPTVISALARQRPCRLAIQRIQTFNTIQDRYYASRASRRSTPGDVLLESRTPPPDAPKTSTSWERKPAVEPRKGYWKTAILLVWATGPAYALYMWITSDDVDSRALLSKPAV
ncbi:hypothetical protein PIIN_09727 [Serendipita indica DSM 11827]|uniref:Uncharacterized protein n=1 Tax=Serendipita indica (strain DSM 11827) TaxID=1109443 RepID=G4TWP4_SERID|nr:hypothetical protein PIIN_09727 [Serendipita indica DSM 11827]